MRPAGWNSRSPKKLRGDYVATDNGVVPDGKTSDIGKMDSFPDGLAVKRNASVVPLAGDGSVTNPGGREDWFRSRPTTSLFSISLTNHKHSTLTFNGLLTYNSYSRSITV